MFERPLVHSLRKEMPVEKVDVQIPAAESLLDPSLAAASWSEDVISHPDFYTQVAKRNALIHSLDQVINRLGKPTTTVEKAIEEGVLSNSDVETMYRELSYLLEDRDYERCLLYMPFEFLPSASWLPEDEGLKKEVEHFRAVYLSTWERLLSVQDVRANFVDGDVVEVDRRVDEPPRVVKAAHLIPILVQKGLIDASVVIDLLEDNDNAVLRSSVASTIPVLFDLKLLDEGHRSRMMQSHDQELGHMALYGVERSQESLDPQPVTIDVIKRELDQVLMLSGAHEGVAHNRAKWLQESAVEDVTKKLATQLMEDIISGRRTVEEVAALSDSETRADVQIVIIGALEKSIERMVGIQLENTDAAAQLLRHVLDQVRSSREPNIVKEIAKTVRKLHVLGVFSDELMEQYGVTEVNFHATPSEIIQPSLAEIKQLGGRILASASESEVGGAVYPAALVYGSRIKGYGQPNSDLDSAIFIKPGTPASVGSELQSRFPGAVQFWLLEDEHDLCVKDFQPTEQVAGSSSWVHVLFGGVWIGDSEAINEIRRKLLTRYMYISHNGTDYTEARKKWLEEIERDVLQYRLLHRGYDQVSPSYGGIEAEHADLIDGSGTFWDSGYRRVAMQLYARKVFLPKLSERAE